MDQRTIFRVALALPVFRLFDYLAPDNVNVNSLHPGIRLEVPFGKSKKIAFLIAIAADSDFDNSKIKKVVRILDEEPLITLCDLRLLQWASSYYHHPLGEVVSLAFPTGLRQGKLALDYAEKRYCLTEYGKTINSEDLKRAPRQKKILELFLSGSCDLSEAELQVTQRNFHGVLKQLINKKIVQPSHYRPAKKVPESLLRQNPLPCNPEQQYAVDLITQHLGRFAVFLLEGVTGSGKTEVYMQIIHTALQNNQQVLVLLPEINLTPQLEGRFKQRFAVDIAVSHSKLSDNQRQHAWLNMQKGISSIMLGTRSALFTPLRNPGLIILDEEHDSSFKQQEGFRFSARNVAVMRGKMLNIPVVLGSATPALESLNNVQRQRYQLLKLTERAGHAVAPDLQLLDIRNKKMVEGLSEPLVEEIKSRLDNKEQVLLFLNRRGFAPTLICHGCGWVARCKHCDANLVIHRQEHLLRCHHCCSDQSLINACPACSAVKLMPLGLGTERIERVLADLFPSKTVVRLDKDTTQRKGRLENYLEQIQQGNADIILGTQMLAKGHHFPNVTLVAVLDVDSGLFSIDFHSAEKLAQQIVQVSGRAGRADKSGRVILQTRRPEHPLLLTLIHEGYDSFASKALAERKLAQLPPFSYQALIRAQARDVNIPRIFLMEISEIAKKNTKESVQIMGPVPAPMAKKAGSFRFQLLFQAGKRQELQHLLDVLLPKIELNKKAKKLRWSLDVDPVDLY